MEVNDELINDLARLARLEFNDVESKEIKADLQKMITFIDKLNGLDTRGTEPLVHMSDTVNILRDDIAEQTITQEQALRNAPLHDDKFFKVPKVIKK